MSRITGATKAALSAARVDLADNTFAYQISGIFTRVNDTDELVTDRPGKSGVAAYDLEIGVANSRFDYADPSFAARGRYGNLIEMCTLIPDA